MRREQDSIVPTMTGLSNYSGRIEFPTSFIGSRLGTTGNMVILIIFNLSYLRFKINTSRPSKKACLAIQIHI